jgi:uncharacterized protein
MTNRATIFRLVRHLPLAVLLAWGPGPALATEAFKHEAVARATLDAVIRPGAALFAEKATTLETAAGALCAEPSEKALRAGRAAFRSAARYYARIEFIAFGPNRTDNRRERLLLYPDPKGLVRRQVEKALTDRDASVTATATLQGKSVALQGFSALELLLFEPESRALASAGEPADFRCRYAAAAAGAIATVARAMRDEWADPKGFGALMLSPGPDNPAYLQAQEVTQEIVQSFIDGLDATREKRLAAPMGMLAPNKPPTPSLLGTSSTALPFITGSVEGLRALYRAGGLKAAIARDDRAIAGLIDAELSTALKAFGSLRVDIGQIERGTEPWQVLLAAGFPLKNAQQQAAVQLAQAAGITMGFNAGDGD